MIEAHVLMIGAMVCGFAGHLLKKVVEQRHTDESFSIAKYLATNPYGVALAFLTAVAGYLAMLNTEHLTPLSAFMAGYMANSMGEIARTSRP
jgi:hypothetical protein